MGRVATLADIEAIERVPLPDRDLPVSTYALLERGAATAGPASPALHFFLRGTDFRRSHTLAYDELLGGVRQTANLLHGLGIGSDDVVSILLPNLPETFFSILGAETVGIANPINPLLEPEVIAEIMNAAASRVLIALAPVPKVDIWDKVEAIREHVPTLRTVILVRLSQYLSTLPRIALRLAATFGTKPRAVKGQRVVDFARACGRQPADRLVFDRTISPDDIASYFHTGGTTGRPKLAPHTHGNEVFNAWVAGEIVDLESSQTGFCGLPLFHVNGVVITGLTPFCRGASVVIGSPQGYRGAGVIANFWAIVDHFRLSSFSAVPTVYSALLDVPVGDADVDSLIYAACGAAPMPTELFRRFEAATGVRILEGYGLTEGTCISALNPLHGDRRIGSIGFRLPYQSLKTVILDAGGEYERDCGIDEIGAVVIRGPNVFKGYLDVVQQESLWIDDGDGQGRWLNTGDLGRQDADGYIWLTGREKELIIRGGHNIDPALIEEPMIRHPAVAMAAAVARPEPRVGEVPVVYVQLRPDASANTAELLEHARAQIGERAAIPKAVRIVEELPLTAIGKTFKPALRWREIDDVVTDEVEAVAGVRSVRVNTAADQRTGASSSVRVTAEDGVAKDVLRAEIEKRLGAYAITAHVSMDADADVNVNVDVD